MSATIDTTERFSHHYTRAIGPMPLVTTTARPATRTAQPNTNHIAMTRKMWDAIHPAPAPQAIPCDKAHLEAFTLAHTVVERAARTADGTAAQGEAMSVAVARRQLEALAEALPVSVYDHHIDRLDVIEEQATDAGDAVLRAVFAPARAGRELRELKITGTDLNGLPEYAWVAPRTYNWDELDNLVTDANRKQTPAERREARERLARLEATNNRAGMDSKTRRAVRRAGRFHRDATHGAGVESNNATRVLASQAPRVSRRHWTREVNAAPITAEVGCVTSDYGTSIEYSPAQGVAATTDKPVSHNVTHRILWAIGADGVAVRAGKGDVVQSEATTRRTTQQGKTVTVARTTVTVPVEGPVLPGKRRLAHKITRTRIVADVVAPTTEDAPHADATITADLRSGAAYA